MTSSLVLASAIGFGFAHAFEPDHMAAVSTFVAQRPTPREALAFGLKWASGHGASLFLLGSVLYLGKRAVESSQPILFSSGVLDRFVGFILVLLGINALLRLCFSDAIPRTLKGWKALLQGQRLPSRSLEQQLVEQQMTATKLASSQQDDEELPLFGKPDSQITRAAVILPTPTPSQKVQSASSTKSANALWGGSVLMGLLHGAAGTGAFIGQAVVALSSHYSSAMIYTFLFSVGVLFAMGVYSTLLGGVISWGAGRSIRILRGIRFSIGVLTCIIGVCLVFGVELPGLLDKIVAH